MSGLNAALTRRVGIEEWLVWSTITSTLLFVPLNGSLQAGYLVVLVNALVLLVFDRLALHRNHLLAILGVAGFSMIGARLAGTPTTAIVAQVIGISVMSVYYFSALTNLQLSVSRWMELYMRAALALAVLALFLWPVTMIYTGDRRLRGIYSEPSFYVYVTLPAVGYCINCFVNERRYGWETLIFLLTYAFADSSLGFLGLLLIALFAYARRMKGWQMLAGSILLLAMTGTFYVASSNFRIRINELIRATISQDLSGTGSSTFAFLSNLYVTGQSFAAHPLTGIGIGGYAHAYDTYIGNITGGGITGRNIDFLLSMQLNRDDANSMILRVAAELGIPGLLILLGFLIICARVRGKPYLTIRNAILPYLMVRMMRMGAYFTVEFYFFVGLYLLNYLNYRAAQPASVAPAAGALERPTAS